MTLPRKVLILALGSISLFATGAGVGASMMQSDPWPMPAPAQRMAPQPYTLPLAYAQLVIFYCDESGVPVWLAARLFAWESGWNPRYQGRVNANGTYDRGLAALNSASLATFAALYNDGRAVDPYDPETSIRVGIRYLAALHAQHGTWREAVRKYAGNRPASHVRAIMGG